MTEMEALELSCPMCGITDCGCEEEAEMERGEQRMVERNEGTGAKYLGFVRRTLGGFWRGYSYEAGMGFGPFGSEDEAETWVRETSGE